MSDPQTYTPPPNPGDTLRRVLVIKLGALGDFIQALGAMRVVRATHPSARITLLTTEPFEAFAKACPYFDIVEANGRPRDLKGRADLIKNLRSAGYDMVYDFQNNDRTAQYYAAMTGKKPLWSGAAKGASHQHLNPNRAEMHNFDRLTEQLYHAGLKPGPLGNPTGWVEGHELTPSLEWIRPAFRNPPRFQPEFFNLYGPYMIMIPGSSAEHPEKRWPLKSFAAVGKWLADGGVTPVVVGTKAEGDIGTQLMKMEPRIKSIIGRTDLFQLATLAERAVLAIGGDTGPMHLAAAARAPGVCLFAQEWTPEMAYDLLTVWNPQTRLGRAAPRGGPMILLHAANLEEISIDDVKWAAIGLGTLPTNIARPARAEPEPAPAPNGENPPEPSVQSTPESPLETSGEPPPAGAEPPAPPEAAPEPGTEGAAQ